MEGRRNGPYLGSGDEKVAEELKTEKKGVKSKLSIEVLGQAQPTPSPLTKYHLSQVCPRMPDT